MNLWGRKVFLQKSEHVLAFSEEKPIFLKKSPFYCDQNEVMVINLSYVRRYVIWAF